MSDRTYKKNFQKKQRKIRKREISKKRVEKAHDMWPQKKEEKRRSLGEC